MIKVIKINDSLNVSFDYDADIVSKVKTIRGRKYNPNSKSWDMPLQAIHKLKELFNDLDISEDVDQDYKAPKYDFRQELESVNYKPLKIFAEWCLNQLPNYFYEVAASSTGKYHPAYALGEGGLVRHTIAAMRIAEELFRCETIQEFEFREKNIIKVALLLHDGVKHGTDGSEYTVAAHPIEVVKYLEDRYFEVPEETLPDEVIEIMECDLWEDIASCIKSHMGQWNTDYKTGEEILPKPQTEMQKFTHLCDYLASRKMLEVNFNVEG
ncbi:HD domain-containing protein [Clostridium botulinum]|nr:HD domain-containing protein [Clostridium botulinum]